MDIDKRPGESSSMPDGVSASSLGQHVWSSAGTAYEALALSRAALCEHEPGSGTARAGSGISAAATAVGAGASAGRPHLDRASFAALLATLHTAAAAYQDHLSPRTSERHERLIHERSRLHASRVQMANTLAHGFGLPLRGSRDVIANAELLGPAGNSAEGAQGGAGKRIALPRELTERLYAALVQLHPVRPCPPSSYSAPTAAFSSSSSSGGAGVGKSETRATTTEGGAGGTIDLPPTLAPSPRISAALATLALTTLSNIITSPARSLFALEVFAEHFDLDRSTSAGTGGGAGGGAGVGSAGAGPVGAGVTSPSVAVSPAVMPPETVDGGRAVSVIMLGGTVLVVDIELGVKDWSSAGTDGSATVPAAAGNALSASTSRLPEWAKQGGHLAWVPTVHVKITFANDPSASAAERPGEQGTEGKPASTSSSAVLAAALQRHLLVMAQILLLGFPLDSQVYDDEHAEAASTSQPTGDGDVSMVDAEYEGQARSTGDVGAQDVPASTSSVSDSDALRDALRTSSSLARLDPALRLVHTDLYGSEHYLLARHHLQAFVRVLARLAALDKERSSNLMNE